MQRGRGGSEMIPSIILDHLNNVAQHIHLSVCVSPPLSVSVSLFVSHIDTHCDSHPLSFEPFFGVCVCACARLCAFRLMLQ